MTRRASAPAVVAAAVAATLLAACTPDEEPPEVPTSAEPTTSETATEPASLSEDEAKAQAEKDGLDAVEQYVLTYYTIANGGYSDEGLISTWLDTLGPNLREVMRGIVERAQAQDWSIAGTPEITLVEMTDYEVLDDYTQFVLRVCEDRTETVPAMAGEPTDPDNATLMDYTVYIPASGGPARVDDIFNTKEECS